MNRYFFGILLAMVIFPNQTVNAMPSCGISSVSLNQLYLKYNNGNATATALEIQCAQKYNIIFDAKNLNNINGASRLIDRQGHQIHTKMTIDGATRNLWRTPISPINYEKQKFIVRVMLNERPNAFQAAGEYEDQLRVSIVF
ncbi:hypothetical protein [Acinetobacter sp. MD2]|uniref:hypothetical protein n=1 Tax=Acinetobacter sp. MD2 TaxID=2600066 RepID=UPI002D1EAAD4|nr:hypothetical protein [Acinetobacter sp. MD2]MEB3767322.1 hypothetical protein [Acinetobacter sp. MD2]